MPVAQRMTADEFLARPFEEGLRGQELVDGELGREPRRSTFPPALPAAQTGDRGPLPLDLALRRRRQEATYERHGLPELWLVDTSAEEVLVFRRSRADATGFDVAFGRGDTLGSPLLPSFGLGLDELFKAG